MMLDFGASPPEIISALIHTGAGAGPLMTAAACWDSLCAQLNSFALGYSATISELHDTAWSGPAATTMVAAAEPYLAWVTTTAALAEQTASRARAAAAAYDAVLAAVVPPALVEANRAQRAMLVATNVFAQNTATIAALDAAYLQMWAQDTGAMYGYAASSSAATALAPFAEPPQTTSAAGQSAPGASDSTTPDLSSMVSATSQLNTLTGPAGFAEANARTATSAGSFFSGIYRSILQSQGAVSKALPELGPAVSAVPTAGDSATLRNAVLAGVGRAEPIGGLSVPQRWAAAVPAPTTFAEPPWLSEAELAEAVSWEPPPASTSGMPGTEPMAGMGPMAAPAAASAAGRPTVNSVLRVGPRRFTMPRPAVGG